MNGKKVTERAVSTVGNAAVLTAAAATGTPVMVSMAAAVVVSGVVSALFDSLR